MRFSTGICLALLVTAARIGAIPLPMFAGLPSPYPNSHPLHDAASVAYGISADGLTIVGAVGGTATRWTSSGSAALLPGPIASVAYALSPDGSTAVGYRYSGGNHPNGSSYTDPVRWVGNGPSEALAGPDSFEFSEAYDVSNGAIVVGSVKDYLGSDQRAFRWTPQGFEFLGDLPGGGTVSSARGVTADGSRIVGWSEGVRPGETQAYREAVIWESEVMIRLGDLPGGGGESFAYGISSDGKVVVGWSDSSNGYEPFRWTAETGMVGLGFLPGVTEGFSDENAFAVSGDGSVIVGTVTRPGAPSEYEAFVWDADHGMQSLQSVLTGFGVDTTGWDLIEARGISDDGSTIVGWGYNPSGVVQGWIAVIPEPATAGLLAAGLVMLAWRRQRGR